MPDEALETVRLRNNFYRDNYRRLLSAVLVCLVIITCLSGGLIYLATHRPQPQYFATSDGWRLVRLEPLSTPIMNDSQVLQWATSAVNSIFDFNFVNYRKQLQESSQYFTTKGYQQFLDALKASNNLDTIKERKLVVSAVATQAPVVVNQGVINGRYAWEIQMPIMVSYEGAGQRVSQPLVLTLMVVRAPTLAKPSGVAIAQFVEAPASGPVGE